MNARDRILNNVRRSKPAFAPLGMGEPVDHRDLSIDNFKKAININGGQFFEVDNLSEIESFIASRYSSEGKVASDIVSATISIHPNSGKSDLNAVEVSVLKAEVGVVENAALWLPEKNMLHRSLPFITQHLILVIDKKDIVNDMHQAYKKLDLDSYGVFIAGPSKTADIEQSLVIGAHGARTHTVFLLS